MQVRKAISEFILFRLWGWKLEGAYPNDIMQSVVMTMPHTSNWDFPLGILLRPIMHTNIRFLGKDSLFRPPLGWLMRSLGGYPVDRSKHNNFTDAVADIYKKEADFKLCITPEGTRKKVTKLKSGFYYIAVAANVPIICAKFDWGKMVLSFSQEPFYPTGDYEKDLDELMKFFEGSTGRVPKYDYIHQKG